MKTPEPALPQTTVTLDGTEYRLTALPSAKGRPALLRLMRLVAPHTRAVLARELSPASVVSAILEIASDLSEEDFNYFYKLFEPNTEVMAAEDFVPVAMGGQPWIAEYEHMVQIMVEHCRFNFGSFFEFALRHLVVPLVPTQRAVVSPAPST